MKQLVSSGANINARSKESKNHTALHEAVIGGHKEVAQYLLQMGANQVSIRLEKVYLVQVQQAC